MKRAWLALPVACALTAAGCGGGRPRGPMSDGERTYRSKCGACHRLHEPGERTKEQWESAVAKMQRLKKVRLSKEEEELILAYLAGPEPATANPGAGPASPPAPTPGPAARRP